MDGFNGKDVERFKPRRAALPYMQPCLDDNRAKLATQMQQLELLQSGKLHIGERVFGDMVQETIVRLTEWTAERRLLIRALETGAPV